jgi:hypothetical protein
MEHAHADTQTGRSIARLHDSRAFSSIADLILTRHCAGNKHKAARDIPHSERANHLYALLEREHTGQARTG